MAHYQADMPELGACEDAAAQMRRRKKITLPVTAVNSRYRRTCPAG